MVNNNGRDEFGNVLYAVCRCEPFELLAVGTNHALCENIVIEESQDEDDLIVITRVDELNGECRAAVDAFLAR